MKPITISTPSPTRDLSATTKAMFMVRGNDVAKSCKMPLGGTEPDRVAREVFGRLYDDPAALAQAEKSRAATIADVLHTAIDADANFNELRGYTMRDPVASAASAAVVLAECQSAIDAIDFEAIEKAKETIEKSELPEELDESGDPIPGPTAQEIADAEQAIASANAKLRAAVKIGNEKAVEAEKEVVVMARGCGADPAELGRHSPDLSAKIRQLVCNPKIKGIIRKVGQLREIISRIVSKKFDRSHGTPFSIEAGSDIRRLLPKELAELAGNDDHALLAARRLQNNESLQYSLRKRIPKGRGPFVVLIDCSGSMTGHPLETAISLACALAILAHVQKRAVKILPFNTQVFPVAYVPTPAGLIAAIEELISIYASGGTDIMTALRSAAKFVADQPKSDIVLLSDGYDPSVSSVAVVERAICASTGGRLHYMHAGHANDVSDVLRRVATSTIVASSFDNVEVFDGVAGALQVDAQ